MNTQWNDQWKYDDNDDDDSDYDQNGSTGASQHLVNSYASPFVPWETQQKNQTKRPKNGSGWSLECPFAPRQPSASTCWPLVPADLVQHDLPSLQSSPSVGDLGESSESTWSTYKTNSAGAEPQIGSPRTLRPTPNSAADPSAADSSARVHGGGSSAGDLIDSMQSMWTKYGEPGLRTKLQGCSSRSPLLPLSSLGSSDTECLLSKSPTTEEPLPAINPKFEARLPHTVGNSLDTTTPLRQQQQQQGQADGWDNLPPVNSNSQQPRSGWSWNLRAPEFVPSSQRYPSIAAPAPDLDLDLILFESPPLKPQSLPDVDHGILLDQD